MNPSVHIRSGQSIELSQSALLLQYGNKYCCYAVMNYLTKELVEFGYYRSLNNNSGDLEENFLENEIFNQKYSRSALVFDVNEMLLIPATHFNSEDSNLHMQAIFGKDPGSVLLSESVAEQKLYVIYRVGEKIHHTVKSRFVNGNFRHLASLLLKNKYGKFSDQILIDFKDEEFTVMALKNHELLLVNSFSYSSPEDVIYILLKLVSQYNLSQQDTQIILSGMIVEDSALYRELHKYFIQLQFESLPAEIKLDSSFNEYPAHYYSSICKLALCVS